jgi:hypothetical protein
VARSTGSGIVSTPLWMAWNVKKASEILKKGVDSAEPGKFYFHMHNSGFDRETHLPRAMFSRVFRAGKAVAVVYSFCSAQKLSLRVSIFAKRALNRYNTINRFYIRITSSIGSSRHVSYTVCNCV